MKLLYWSFFGFLIFILFLPKLILAQGLAINSIQDEQLRLLFLLQNEPLPAPINRPYNYIQYNNLLNNDKEWWSRSLTGNSIKLSEKTQIGLHPLYLQNTYNSLLPIGENNQAAWYGSGHNPELMTGFWFASNFVTFSIYPHLIWQQNKDFLSPRFVPSDRYVIEGIAGVIDAPYRFGSDSYWTIDWGYSSLRLHYGALETGLSSEPLWWGPSNRYPLMMSNNAPGIHHAFFGTRKPLLIPYLGQFQFRWIIGYPHESNYADHATAGETRFINALNGSWTPAFLPTLTIGATRSYQLYEADGFDWNNVTVMFDPFQKSKLTESARENWQRTARDQTATFYALLLIPGANAEIYGEFFREDHSYDLRDFLQQPHQNGGWSFGFQKIFFAQLADLYKVNLEFTNLTMTQIQQTRSQTYYYAHSLIRHGHTNRGHILGAAIGPGSNSQFLSIDGYRGDYKAGFFVQRVTENDNFHLLSNTIESTPNENFGDYFRHRVNLNLGLNFLYGPGPFYLTGSYVWTKAYNYGRFDYGRLQGINITNYEHKDLYNSQLQIGITYVF